MEESENKNIIYSGSLIAKNTIYNLLGYGVPIVIALVTIPFLIKGLGTEKFGILNLAWVVIGYFSFFDFGIGRALTKIIAEKIGTSQSDEIPSLFWTSFFLMFFISVIGTLVLFFLTPHLVYNVFKISTKLQSETLYTFYILALSVPIVTTTAGIRGVLEAYQEFGIMNIIRTFLGLSMFVIPLICLIFTKSLMWIVVFLLLIRVLVWILYLIECFKLNKKLKSKISFEINLIKPILKLSGWITVSNIIVPLIVYADRFMIGALVSATAIAYYATPYEVVTKLLLIPSALIGVLFPAFSASYSNNPDFTKKLLSKAVKYIFIFLFPVVILIISFAHVGMSVWLGKKFAENSTLILQLLAVGVLFNGIAYIPFTFLQGIGRPDITAKVNLIEIPFYFISMWLAIRHSGIKGAAFVWLIRMLADTGILFFFANKILASHSKFKFNINYIYILILSAFSLFPILINNLYLKFTFIVVILTSFLLISWKYFLLEEEKVYLISHIKVFKF